MYIMYYVYGWCLGGSVSRSWRVEPVSASRPKDGGLKERTDDEYTPQSDTGSWREEKKTPEIGTVSDNTV